MNLIFCLFFVYIFKVIDGGDLDINFFIQAPDGKVVISEHKKSDNLHR